MERPSPLIRAALWIVAVLALSACGGGVGGGGVGPSVRELFVANIFSGEVSVFDADQTGNIAPLRRFGSITGLVLPWSCLLYTSDAADE